MVPFSNEEIVKLANASSAFKNLLLKVAQSDSTGFNENPPVNDDTKEEDGEAKKNKDTKPPENVPQPPVGAVPPGAIPQAPANDTPEMIGARAAQAFIGPETMQAALAGEPGAQEIIARTAGHVAGAVSEAATKTMNAGSTLPENSVPAEGVPAEGVPSAEGGIHPGVAAVPAAVPAAAAQPLPQAPEGAVADSIIPPQNAPAPTPAQPPAEGVPPQGGSKAQDTQVVPSPAGQPTPANGGDGGAIYDAQTVAKMIQLAKAGKI